MDTRQDYRLDNTNIYATLEATGHRTTRCTFRNSDRKVVVTVSVRLQVCEIAKCAHAANEMRHEIPIMQEVIKNFPDWGEVLLADEDEWSPID